MPSPCDRHRPSPASCTRSFPIRRTTTRPVDPAWRHEIVNFAAVPSALSLGRVSIRRAPNRRVGGGGRDCWRDKPRGIKVLNIGGKFLSHRRSRHIEDLFGGCGPSIFGFSNRDLRFFLPRPSSPRRTRPRHNTRERPDRESSHPLASPGQTPGARTEGPQGPTRTRTNPTQGRGEIYLEIIQRQRR